MKNLNQLPRQNNSGTLTPFEQFEAEQNHAPYYSDEDDYTDLEYIMPRNNGTQAGIEALRASLARG